MSLNNIWLRVIFKAICINVYTKKSSDNSYWLHDSELTEIKQLNEHRIQPEFSADP